MRILSLLVLGCVPRSDGGCSRESGCDTGTVDTADTAAIVINPYLSLQGAHPKNVIILSYDTLRRDHVNAMGYEAREVTPTLDKVFVEGVGFYNHRSCSSWTFPSFTCVLTGRDQVDNDFWPYAEISVSGTNLPEAPQDLPLAAKVFKDLGYHTGVFAASGFLGSASAMDQGMDDGYGVFGSTETGEEEMKADEVLHDAMEYLDDRLGEPEVPFFVHIHFMEPHMPWTPPEKWLAWEQELEPVKADFGTETSTKGTWQDILDGVYTQSEIDLLVEHMLARYDGEIRSADDYTAELFEYLEREGLWEDTIVMFVTDHGEEFLEHGNFNHGYNSFDEQIRSVAGFYQPGNLLPAQVSEMTLHQDLMPTLFAILDQDPSVSPAYREFTGLTVGTDAPRPWSYNLVFRFNGDPSEAEKENDRTHQAVTDGNSKIMFRWDDDGRVNNGGPKYFYDLTTDPAEADNIYSEGELTQKAWWDLLCPFIEALDDAEPDTSPDTPPECPRYE